MPTARLRLWILTGLNLLALSALVLFLLQKISATMYWVSSGIAILAVIAAVLLIPLGCLALLILKRWSGPLLSAQGKIYFRSSTVFLLLAWLCLSPIGTFWGAIFLHIWEPWPLSLAQGPDTERARDGFRRVLGFAPPRNVHDIYYKGFALRDSSDYLRFGYGDPKVVEEIVQAFDLVPLSDDLRAAKRHTHLGKGDEPAAWWTAGQLERAGKVYVNRSLSEYFEDPAARYGVIRILWVDEAGRLAYVAQHTF
jgi:hypothetical protein